MCIIESQMYTFYFHVKIKRHYFRKHPYTFIYAINSEYHKRLATE